MWRRLVSTSAPAATIVVRLMVGAVFVSEGIQKFLFPDALGAGRFLEMVCRIRNFSVPLSAPSRSRAAASCCWDYSPVSP